MATPVKQVGNMVLDESGLRVPDRREIDRTLHVTTKEQELDHFIAQANEARRDFEDASQEYTKLVTLEAELEAHRPLIKHGAVLRLMEEDKLAATNAEKQATISVAYLDHLEVQRGVVAKKNDAWTRLHSADLRAQTAIAAVKAIGGWV